jgi:uncharacterized protein (DUF58 family)
VTNTELTFSLVPKRRLLGLAFGAMRSARRGAGSDVSGSRPYLPGDDMDTIDWAGSAKLSAARGQDEFIVRERYADEAPYVACVCDRRPEMAHVQPHLPWLSKPAAMHVALELIQRAVVNARGFIAYLDFATGDPYWVPPTSVRAAPGLGSSNGRGDLYQAPPRAIALALTHLREHRRVLPAGSFVFLLSDFLEPLTTEDWLGAIESRWDVVPVVIQDPVWEQSFPDVSGMAFPFSDPRTGRVTPLRLTPHEVFERRARNEQRLRAVLDSLRDLSIEPILVSDHEPDHVSQAFAAWTEQRLAQTGRRW